MKHLNNVIKQTQNFPNILFYWRHITKTYLYNFDPLNPHFYILKLGFTGVYIIFLIFARKHKLWVRVPIIYVLGRNMKKKKKKKKIIRAFLSENFQF